MSFFTPQYSEVFGSTDAVMENTLKNPNLYQQALVMESLMNLPEAKRKEFIHSNEARSMLEGGILTHDMLEKLAAESKEDDDTFFTTIFHMAKEADDPLWSEFVAHRIEERRIMNDMIAKYGKEARPVADTAHEKYVESVVPEYFRK